MFKIQCSHGKLSGELCWKCGQYIPPLVGDLPFWQKVISWLSRRLGAGG